jgi:hypothetical protein
MASIAYPAGEARIEKEDRGVAALFHSPAIAAALLSGAIALVVAFVGPMVARTWQNHEKRLEVRTILATDMSRSFTMAVGAGQRVASGLIYGPTGDRARNAAIVQAAYNSGLGQWQIDGGRITAELSARFGDDEIVQEWRSYRLAVTRFYRLSAVLPTAEDRRFLVGHVRSYFKHVEGIPAAASALPRNVNWKVLQRNKRFSRNLDYRRTYDKLSFSFLSLGDAFVEEVLQLDPKV